MSAFHAIDRKVGARDGAAIPAMATESPPGAAVTR